MDRFDSLCLSVCFLRGIECCLPILLIMFEKDEGHNFKYCDDCMKDAWLLSFFLHYLFNVNSFDVARLDIGLMVCRVIHLFTKFNLNW